LIFFDLTLAKMKTKKIVARAIWWIIQWVFILAVMIKLLFMAINLIRENGAEIFKFF